MTDSGFDLDFIQRTLKTTGVVLLVSLVFGMYYFGVYPSLAFFSGGVWSMVNLMFITRIIQSAMRPEGADKMRTLSFALIKFPLLYLAGYGLLKVPQFEALHLVLGFSLLLVILVLKVVGRSLVTSGEAAPRSDNAGRVR